jgi:hypothetical protein
MAVSRIPLAVALLLSMSCGWEEAPPPLPPPPPPALTLAGSGEGCYEHVPGEPGRPSVRHTAPWELPERFYLGRNEIASGVGNAPKATKITQAGTYRAMGHWQRIDDNAIRLTWTNGSEGVQVALRRSSTDGLWRGQTEPFSNMGGVVIRSQAVVVRRVADAACQ